MPPDIAIQVENVGKRYRIYHEQQRTGRRYVALRDVIAETLKGWFPGSKRSGSQRTSEDFWALKDVSFEIKKGEAVGVIGRNGAGKSTLLKVLSRITEPTKGNIGINGRVASLLEVGTGFHPELTGRENIYLNGAILGMRRVEIRSKFDEIVAFAEVEQFIDTPVKRYSSGMYMRLAFAVAAHLEPKILIVDEVLAVGDAAFQKKCLGRMNQVSSEGRTVLFVSHSMDSILRLCSQAILLHKGEMIDSGTAREVVSRYTAGHAIQTREIQFTDFKAVDHNRRNLVLTNAEWPASKTTAPWTVPYGEPISFLVSFECLKSVKGAELGIALYSPSGTEIASTSSIVCRPELNLLPGQYQFSVTYRNLKLIPNNYTFGVGLKSEAGTEDHYPSSFSVEVVPTILSSEDKTDTFWGCVVPDVAYEFHRC